MPKVNLVIQDPIPWATGYYVDGLGRVYDKDGAKVPTRVEESNVMVEINGVEYSLAVVLVSVYMMDSADGENRFLMFVDRDVFNVTVANLRWSDLRDAGRQLSSLSMEIEVSWMIERIEAGLNVIVFKRSTVVHSQSGMAEYHKILHDHYWTGNDGKIWSNRCCRFLVPYLNSYGYPCFSVSPTKNPAFVHRLVATSFVNNPDPVNNTIVNHRNGKKDDSCWINLEWTSLSENAKHSRNILGNPGGATGITRKFTDGKTVIYPTLREAMRSCGVPISSRRVSDAIKNKTILYGSLWEYTTLTAPIIDLPAEEFIAIPDSHFIVFPSLGRILNVKKHVWASLRSDNRGYQKVNLHVGGKQKQVSLHRTIAEAVWGPIPEGMQIDHKDGDPTNNVISNLEIVTRQQNIIRAVERSSSLTNNPLVVYNSRNITLTQFNNCRDAANFYRGNDDMSGTLGKIISGSRGCIECQGLFPSIYPPGKTKLEYIQELTKRIGRANHPVESLTTNRMWFTLDEAAASTGSKRQTVYQHCIGVTKKRLFAFVPLTELIDQITFQSFDPNRDPPLMPC
jgi:hypothetical protein